MKQADTNILSDADLTTVQGGYPADPNSNVPEDPTGKPLLPLPRPRSKFDGVPGSVHKGASSIIQETEPTPPTMAEILA
jgi:hypothetical protein